MNEIKLYYEKSTKFLVSLNQMSVQPPNTSIMNINTKLRVYYPHLSQRSANSPDRSAQPLRH